MNEQGMKFARRRNRVVGATAMVALLLSACDGGGASAPRVLTPEEQELKQLVETRQRNFQDIGAAFKAVNDELQAGRPGSTTAVFSIESVARYAPQVRSWFPEGTGPDSGFKTDAKAEIWDEAEDFESVLAEFEAAVRGLSQAGASGDANAISASFRATGATCKSCHDKFRKED